jgi:single-stranded-DNA-specific exonuclease
MTALDTAIASAREVFREWISARDRAGRIVVFCHFDADGLAAGALLGRGLPRLGFADVRVVPSGRESAFSDAARQRIAALEPAALVVTDLGVNRLGVLPGVPTLYVDHHRPEGEPAGATVISGYGWDPIPTSAWLAYELLRPLAEVDDLLWIAAVGTLSDLGDSAPWPDLPVAKKRFTAKWLKEVVVLVNAARRASAFDVETPLALLMRADHPRAVSEDDGSGADHLRAYRAEVPGRTSTCHGCFRQWTWASSTAPSASATTRHPAGTCRPARSSGGCARWGSGRRRADRVQRSAGCEVRRGHHSPLSPTEPEEPWLRSRS